MIPFELQITFIIVMTILSAFFSGAETVFLSASKIWIEVLFRRNARGIKHVYSFIKKPEIFIVTTLIGNNLSQVIFSSFVILIFKDTIDEFLIVLLASSFLLIFAEIIPKAIGREFSNQLIIVTAHTLKIFSVLFAPLNSILTGISNLFLNKFGLTPQKNIENIFTRKDIIKILQESEKAGVIKSKESEIISKIFDLRKTRVKDPMVPRTEMFAVKKDISINELIEKFEKSGFSRIPVYEDTIDNIIGVVYAKDLLITPQNISQIIKDVIFIPDSKNAYELLKEFKQKRASIAIILDEYGGTAGLITIEDLVEELIGEIYDEFDIDREKMYRKLNAFTVVIDARAEIDEINEKFRISIPEKETYSTIGGFIIQNLGHIPNPGEIIELNDCKIIVAKASRKRVIQVKLIRKTYKQ